jgi:hypothetical protein
VGSAIKQSVPARTFGNFRAVPAPPHVPSLKIIKTGPGVMLTVMEKVRIDTEDRKLDQLRAVHLNHQHNIRW